RRAEPLVTPRDHVFVDRDPPADAIYRIGVAANWLDDETRGDVVAISPPVAPPTSSGEHPAPPRLRSRRASPGAGRPPGRAARCRPSAATGPSSSGEAPRSRT